jgi:hypothetical protein
MLCAADVPPGACTAEPQQALTGRPDARCTVDGMDDPRPWLFDPATTRGLVLNRRPADRTALTCVVSDTVWHDVVGLLRWATADTSGVGPLDAGRWWRLAAGCADLLRRLPGLSDELGEPWCPTAPVETGSASGSERVDAAVARLTVLLRSQDALPLGVLAVEIDALGAASISTLAERSSWHVPDAA